MKLCLIPPCRTKSPEKWGLVFMHLFWKHLLKHMKCLTFVTGADGILDAYCPSLCPKGRTLTLCICIFQGILAMGKYGTSTFESFCTEKKHIAHFTSLPKLTKAAHSVCREHWAPDTDSSCHVAGSHMHNMAKRHLDIMLRGLRNVMSTQERRALRMEKANAYTSCPKRHRHFCPLGMCLPPYFTPQ